MAWCPNCKNEYQDGITVCADCGAALVDELPEEAHVSTLALIESEEMANKLIKYLSYSDIIAECQYSEEQSGYEIIVDDKDLKKAKPAYQAFFKVESKQAAEQMLDSYNSSMAKIREFANLSEEDDIDLELLDTIPDSEVSEAEKSLIRNVLATQQMYKPSEVYVKKSDVSNDMKSTAITFIGFGCVMLVLTILSFMKYIKIFSSMISLGTLCVITVGCFIVGINAIGRSKKAAADSVEEDKATEELNEWLESHIDESMFRGIDDETLGIEMAYLKRIALIKSMVVHEFPQLNENYIDSLIEDFYDKKFQD